eukprot:6111948-Amphidinium_carterae.1
MLDYLLLLGYRHFKVLVDSGERILWLLALVLSVTVWHCMEEATATVAMTITLSLIRPTRFHKQFFFALACSTLLYSVTKSKTFRKVPTHKVSKG